MSATSPRPHCNTFDALRLLAAFAVLTGHMYAISGRQDPIALNLSLGLVAVAVFFVISGYLITHSWLEDPTPSRFFARRFLRLWPALAVVVALCSFGVAPLATGHSLAQLFENPQYVQWFGNLWFNPFHREFDAFSGLRYKALNAAIWTIPLEVLCYILLVLLAQTRALKWAVPALLLALLAAFLSVGTEHWIAGIHHPGPWFFLGKFGALFFMGSLLKLHPRLLTHNALCCGAIVVGAGLIVAHQTTLGLTLGLPFLTLRVGLMHLPFLGEAGRWGDFSYGVYLYAWPVQQIVTLTLGAATPVGLLLLAAGGLTLALAVLSWHLVEAPALRLKPTKKFKPAG